MKILLILLLALITIYCSCGKSNGQRTKNDFERLDSFERANILRDSLVLDSIKKDTYDQSSKRDDKIEYSPRNTLHQYLY